MDYGTDFLLENDDLVFTADGDGGGFRRPGRGARPRQTRRLSFTPPAALKKEARNAGKLD